MKEYKREYPQFALCGLNCGLCPRYQTEGSSQSDADSFISYRNRLSDFEKAKRDGVGMSKH